MDEILDREEELDKLRFEKRELVLDHDLFYHLFPEFRDRGPHFDEEGIFFERMGHERLSEYCHDAAVEQMANNVTDNVEFNSSMSRDQLNSWIRDDDTKIVHFCAARREYKSRMRASERETGMGPIMEVYSVFGLDYMIL